MHKEHKEFTSIMDEMKTFLDFHRNEISIFEKKSKEEQVKSSREFLKMVDTFKNDLTKIRLKFVERSLHEAFYIWKSGVEPSIYRNLGEFLVQENFIVLANKPNQPFSIKSTETIDHNEVINAIRCTREYSIDLREGLVLAYLSFFNWLSMLTDSFLHPITDPDELKIQGRIIPFSLFNKFLRHLNEKEQLVAKLLYFGGSRTLEEILSLDLKYVNYEKGLIEFGTQLISYPRHVFNDIKALTADRDKGKVFKGRQNAPLNPATIFRNFKEAAIKVGLGQTFSPKMLTTND